MNRTAACCLALSLCVFALGSYAVLPTLRNPVSRSTPSEANASDLAVLADVSSLPAVEAPTPQPSPTEHTVSPDRSRISDGEPEGVVIAPAQESSSPPALAPEIKPFVLPTVTPQPVALVDQSMLASTSPAVVAPARSPDGCWVASPPAALRLDPFYAKYCSALGIPIVASADVPDAALQRAWAIVTEMLSGMAQAEEVRNSIVRTSTRIGIIGAAQVTTDLPEHRALYALFPAVDWNTRARGVGATPEIPLLSIGEENLLCYPGDLWIGQNVLVHEFAHTLKNMGLDFVDPAFPADLQRTYQQALDAGLWPGTYVISDMDEYWAEGVRLYFQIDGAGVPQGQAYPANSRAELQHYDPELHRLVERIFGPRGGISACPES